MYTPFLIVTAITDQEPTYPRIKIQAKSTPGKQRIHYPLCCIRLTIHEILLTFDVSIVKRYYD